MEGVEFDGDDVGVVDEFGEHATGVDGIELAVITHQHRAPLLRLCDLGVGVEESGVDHSASSMITTEPAGSSHQSGGGVAGPFDAVFVDELVQGVRHGPGTVWSCRAAVADGPTPNTPIPARCQEVTAAASMLVLPAPAGPTTVTTGRVSASIAIDGGDLAVVETIEEFLGLESRAGAGHRRCRGPLDDRDLTSR